MREEGARSGETKPYGSFGQDFQIGAGEDHPIPLGLASSKDAALDRPTVMFWVEESWCAEAGDEDIKERSHEGRPGVLTQSQVPVVPEAGSTLPARPRMVWFKQPTNSFPSLPAQEPCLTQPPGAQW